MSVIDFRIALKLDVKVVWFGCQKAVFVNKLHAKAFFGWNKFQKVNFGCLLLKALDLFTKNWSHFQLCVSFVDMSIGEIFLKWFPSSLLFYTQLPYTKQFRRKPKIILTVIQRFWYVQYVGPTLKTSLLRRLQAQTLPDEAPPEGKIHPFSKIAITFEPIQWFWCPSGFKRSEKSQYSFMTGRTILNRLGVTAS